MTASGDIFFHSECSFQLKQEEKHISWIKQTVHLENRIINEVNIIFCDDQYLLKKNQRYLLHDTLTDVITFDYSEKSAISGDIFISIDRVKENAVNFAVPFEVELKRVMIHGVLHLMGYNDKSAEEKKRMTEKENQYLTLFA